MFIFIKEFVTLFLKNKRNVLLLVLTTCVFYNVFSLVEYQDGMFFFIEKDNEAISHLILKTNTKKSDDYSMPSGAPDSMVKHFLFFKKNNNQYLLVEFDWGSLGTMTRREYVDLYIFHITDQKLKLIKIINIKDIQYDGRTRQYYADRDLSYFYDEKNNSIVLFGEVFNNRNEGKIIQLESYSLNF